MSKKTKVGSELQTAAARARARAVEQNKTKEEANNISQAAIKKAGTPVKTKKGKGKKVKPTLLMEVKELYKKSFNTMVKRVTKEIKNDAKRGESLFAENFRNKEYAYKLAEHFSDLGFICIVVEVPSDKTTLKNNTNLEIINHVEDCAARTEEFEEAVNYYNTYCTVYIKF